MPDPRGLGGVGFPHRTNVDERASGTAAHFERQRYPTDLSDEEWDRIRPLLPHPAGRGRPFKVDLREVLNALRYLARAGCGWRMLPVHFGPWQTIYWWFRRFVRRLLFRTIHDVALMLDRERAGREATLRWLSIGFANGTLASFAHRQACWIARPSKPPMHPAEAPMTQPSG